MKKGRSITDYKLGTTDRNRGRGRGRGMSLLNVDVNPVQSVQTPSPNDVNGVEMSPCCLVENPQQQ